MRAMNNDALKPSVADNRTPGLSDEPDEEGPIGGEAGAQDGPISERVGRDPGNLGDEPPAYGDETLPDDEPSNLQM
jgi:hypothetical protein